MTNGNDAAFAKPTIYGDDEDHPGNVALYEEGSDGLTKREYFAARAMQGLLASMPDWVESYSEHSVRCADELIEALNKRAK